ncbi:unnamed protein product [Pedinophyceae sp. YPF-701]|nr:unnamed protein product [Pedinophyceae sp. YPF-701]
MATLAESFLEDLEELSDEEEEQKEEQDEEGDALMADDEDEDKKRAKAAVRYDRLEDVAKLHTTERYKSLLSRVREELDRVDGAEKLPDSWAGPSSEDPLYQLLVDCNGLAVELDNEITAVHAFLRDKYKPRFPELESLVQNAVDYAKVVRQIGDAEDIATVALEDVLPAAQVMVVSVTASTTAGRALGARELAVVLDACECILALDADKAHVLKLIESRMFLIAPNMTACLGATIAAKLMGVAGGLVAISKMPACNVQVLGQKRNLRGATSSAGNTHQGFVYFCEIVQGTPPAWRNKAAKLVASKCSLMARVDACRTDPAGRTGEDMRRQIRAKIDKWQEPPPARTVKPLPRPDAEVKKRRGGRRLRKMKERYGITDVRKLANRVGFNSVEDEFIDGDEAVGMGMLSSRQGSGMLRAVAQQQKQKLSKMQMKRLEKNPAFRVGAGGGGSGIATSLAFTPVQGIELVNPNRQQPTDARDGTQSYFSDARGFLSVKRPPGTGP